MPRKRDTEGETLNRRVHAGFGRRLAAARNRLQLHQAELGDRMGLSRTSISNIERGARAVYLDQVYQACSILRVDVAELLPPLSEVFPVSPVHTATDERAPDDALTRQVARIEKKLEKASSRPTTSKRGSR